MAYDLIGIVSKAEEDWSLSFAYRFMIYLKFQGNT